MHCLTNLLRGRTFKLVLAGITALGIFAPGVSYAGKAYFLYQLPDGSRMISDRRMSDTRYKLVRSSRGITGLGQQVRNKYDRRTAARVADYEKLIRRTADRYGVDVALVKAVIHTESEFNPNATSHKGASGLMQLMPETAEKYGINDLYNPRQNIEGGVRHLRYLLVKYNYKLSHVIAAYNAGETAVKKYAGIPPYPETQKYVTKVLKYHGFYSTWN
ncbi:MAG: lytic transglycosylase domain-containing protein [Gammaproteobacteria bacterium]|nr:lytic transglycosylase domain-containing protein [Gammaproteobacteria bacterium]MDH5651583.1 lytic transglycosylase domain-containing protein [Gammaproteobacteria bacterium]